MYLRSFNEKFLELWQILFDRLVTSTWIVPRETFREKIFYWKKLNLLSVVWVEIFDRFVNLPPMCPEEQVEYKYLLKEEEVVFVLFRLLRKGFLHSRGKVLLGLTKLGLTSPEHHFEDNWYMWNIHLLLKVLGFWAEKWWKFLAGTFRQDCHNCSLCVHYNNSRKGFFCKSILFSKLTSHLKLD